jgi:transcription initiation factor TFIID subunit 12
MDGSQAQAGQPMGQQQQQHSNLIRTDQVQKLPHLTDQQKAQHTHVVRTLWESLNTRDPQSHEYQSAHIKLGQLSQNLMKGMRIFQQNRQQALQQQQAQAAVVQQTGQPVQRTQSNNPQNLSQLLPQIQAKVSSLNFFLPPNVTQEQVQTWIPEARLRYGIALQKQEVGRARIADLRSQFAQRQSQGAMPNDEVQEFKNRQLAAEKLFREGSEFLNKFKEQQESFKMQSQQNPQMNQAGQGTTAPAAQPAPTAPAAPQGSQAPSANATNAMPGQPPTPAPHTINSAVNAARNQAGQTAMSPTASQPGQGPPSASATPAPPNAQQPGQRPQPPSQQGTPGAQVTFTQTPNADGSTPTSTGPQQVNNQAQGPPRPLSHQAAMQQAAQNYNANQNQPPPPPQAINQASANQQAHPQGYLSNRSTDASARNINMAIPKTLNISTPEAVPMPAARPSLSGGPSHAAPGMMSQPAVQKHPGYVLEGEGQHVLSKKMLDILVRQVTGGGEGEMLTPDAEEVRSPYPSFHLCSQVK